MHQWFCSDKRFATFSPVFGTSYGILQHFSGHVVAGPHALGSLVQAGAEVVLDSEVLPTIQ